MARNVSLYGQAQAPLMGKIARQYQPGRDMASQLMQRGGSMAPVQSNTEGIARALQGALGGYMNYATMKAQGEREGQYSEDMARVLAGAQPQQIEQPPEFVGPPAMSPGGTEGMMQALGAQDNPDLAQFGQQLAMGQIQQQEAAKQDELNRKNKLADAMALKVAPGSEKGTSPYSTPIQTSKGWLSYDNRTGQYSPITSAGGGTALPIAADPKLAGGMAYAKGKGAGEADLLTAAPKAELASTGKAIGVSNMKLYDTVQSGIATVEKADNLIEHLSSSGALTGMGAEMFKGIERLKTVMGDDIASGKVADTEILNAMMGSDVFGMIKSLGIGARGLDTPAEREFMREVLTGTISLNKGTIKRLAEIRRDVGQRAIDKWNDKTERGELDRFYEATGIEKTRLGGKEKSNTDVGGGAVIQSDADYDALPSGTVFTGPDGQQRTKP